MKHWYIIILVLSMYLGELGAQQLSKEQVVRTGLLTDVQSVGQQLRQNSPTFGKKFPGDKFDNGVAQLIKGLSELHRAAYNFLVYQQEFDVALHKKSESQARRANEKMIAASDQFTKKHEQLKRKFGTDWQKIMMPSQVVVTLSSGTPTYEQVLQSASLKKKDMVQTLHQETIGKNAKEIKKIANQLHQLNTQSVALNRAHEQLRTLQHKTNAGSKSHHTKVQKAQEAVNACRACFTHSCKLLNQEYGNCWHRVYAK